MLEVDNEIIRDGSILAAKSLVELMTMRGHILDELNKLDMTEEIDTVVIKDLILKKGGDGANFSPIKATGHITKSVNCGCKGT